jgi:hypothetical protein
MLLYVCALRGGRVGLTVIGGWVHLVGEKKVSFSAEMFSNFWYFIFLPPYALL